MAGAKSSTFCSYLQSLPCELLESVTEDYLWLSGQNFDAPQKAEFVDRREACREECLRRGMPQLYRLAEQVISPWAA
jgi:hypothetical protein